MNREASWVDRYRPTRLDDVQGNTTSLNQLESWLRNFPEDNSPQLLVGDPGTGKTSTVEALSNEFGYPVHEVNASSARTTEDIKRISSLMKGSPADSEYQIVLLDETDSVHHSVSMKPLYKELREPSNPVILTANDKYEVPQSIKYSADIHEFKLSKPSRRAKLKEIADREGLDLDKDTLSSLADRPDLRSAINDLQTWAESGTKPGEDGRTWDEGEFPAMEALLSGDRETWWKATSIEDDTFGQPGDALLWADENLTSEFRGLEAGIAYDVLSRADMWEGRAMGEQEFRYRKYAWALISMLPETRLSSPYGGYINVSFPEWFRSSEAKYDGSTPEAKLYRALKGNRGFRMTGSFFEFRQCTLPILQKLPEDERMELALNHNLDADALEALALNPDDFDDWQYKEEPTEGDGWSPDTEQASVADW